MQHFGLSVARANAVDLKYRPFVGGHASLPRLDYRVRRRRSYDLTQVGSLDLGATRTSAVFPAAIK